MTSIAIHFCPACDRTRSTQKELVEHAKAMHGMSRSEATGGWRRPDVWDRKAARKWRLR